MDWPEARKSPVRFYTLAGGLLGCVLGLWFTIWTVQSWPLLTGGKPIVSLPPFLVIAFELTILIGGLFTVAGLAIHAGLVPSPKTTSAAAPDAGYDARCSVDCFGIFVPCEAAEVEELKRLMLAAGMEDVTVEAE